MREDKVRFILSGSMGINELVMRITALSAINDLGRFVLNGCRALLHKLYKSLIEENADLAQFLSKEDITFLDFSIKKRYEEFI